jgi:hypothetical protein
MPVGDKMILMLERILRQMSKRRMNEMRRMRGRSKFGRGDLNETQPESSSSFSREKISARVYRWRILSKTNARKNKPKPFSLLDRSRSIRDEQSPVAEKHNQKQLEPEKGHTYKDSVKTAPIRGEYDRSFRDMTIEK